MSRQLGHPDPAALARLPAPGLRAGLADDRRARKLSAHAAYCPRCARVCVQLDEVSAVLSAAPLPPLPVAAERRVLVALALEAESRARRPGAPVVPGPARRWPGVPHVLTVSRVVLPAVACLVVLCVGIGYATLGTGQGASPAESASTVAPAPALASAKSAGPGSKEQSPSQGGTVAFVVTDTGTKYRKATLSTQVRDWLAAQVTVPSVEPLLPASAPASPHVPASAGTTGSSRPASGHASGSRPAPMATHPSSSLVGCVMHLTGDVQPELVDRATYQSEPVYVIAVPDEAWVVGRGCTARRPALIASVRLSEAGLPRFGAGKPAGNLSALVSV